MALCSAWYSSAHGGRIPFNNTRSSPGVFWCWGRGQPGLRRKRPQQPLRQGNEKTASEPSRAGPTSMAELVILE